MTPSAASRRRKAGEIVATCVFPVAGSYSVGSVGHPSLPLPIANHVLIVLGLFLPVEIFVAACKNLSRIHETDDGASISPQRANKDDGKNAGRLKKRGLKTGKLYNKTCMNKNRINIAMRGIDDGHKKIKCGPEKNFESSSSPSVCIGAGPLVRYVELIKRLPKALKNSMRRGRYHGFGRRRP